MNKHATVTLDQWPKEFVDQQVEKGSLHSPVEVVQTGLRLMDEQQQAQLEALRAAIIEGEESGPAEPFDFDAFIARKRRDRGL